MKKIIILLCLAIIAMTALASCTNTDCEHPLSADWTSDEANHWHATECEHGEFHSAPEAHVDADENGVCDVCAYETNHEHTYASTWSSNSSFHWKAATCSHADAHTPEQLHVDENDDGFCDECGGHSHVLDSTGTGRCVVCNEQIKEVDTSNLSTVIAALLGGKSNVKSGQIVSLRTMRDGNNSTANKFNTIVEYLVGANSIYYKSSVATEGKSADRDGVEYDFSTSSLTEKWVNKEANGSIFGVYRETVGGIAGGIYEDGGASEDTLFGYYYSVSTLASGYGAEGILKTLYERSQSLNATDYVVEEGDGSFKFSFNYAAVNSTNISSAAGVNPEFSADVQVEAEPLGVNHNVQYFEVEVEFSYSADYTITALNITCDCYSNDAGTIDGENKDDANVDLDYDAITGAITLRSTAKADTYEFITEQTTEGEYFENPYTKAYFSPQGFQVYYDADFISLCPTEITISLTNLPEGESSPYVRFYVCGDNGQKFTSTTAEELEWATSDEAGLSCQFPIGSAFSFATSHVKFLAKAVGTYTVTLSYQGITRTFTVNVIA